MVYQFKEGCFDRPRGNRYPLAVRPRDRVVPLIEIEKLILHLEIDEDHFWSVDDGHPDTPLPKPEEIEHHPPSAGVLQTNGAGFCPTCKRPLNKAHIAYPECAYCAVLN
jgi:hypothetical protein